MDRTTVWPVPDDPGGESGRPPAAAGTRPPDGPTRAGRGWVVAAVVGALLGGAASGGIVAAFDDDRGPASTSSRPATVVGPQLDIAAILDQVEPAVVSISTTGFPRGNLLGPVPSGAGTGMILTPDGDVLTNAHVVAGAGRIEVKLTSGSTMSATLVGSDSTNDVALLRLQGASGLPTVKLARSADLQVGDGVVAIGNALGLPGGPTVTSGIVSALDRAIGGEDARLEHLIQTDAAINPGNSGGPLVNAAAEVVGMNTAVIQRAGGGSDAQNIGFAISSDTFGPIVEELRQGRERIQSRAFLGVVTQTVTADIRARLGLAAPNGALVFDVEPGSPADAAGIRPGDVITGLGGAPVTSSDALGTTVRRHDAGDRVEVTFVRGTATRSVTVTLSQTSG